MHEAQFFDRPITIQSDLAALFADRALGPRALLQITRYTPPQIDTSACRSVRITSSQTSNADFMVRVPVSKNPFPDWKLPIYLFESCMPIPNTDISSYAHPIDIQSEGADHDAFISMGDQKKDGEKSKSDKSKPGKSKSRKGGGREPQEPQEPKTRKVY